MKERGRKIERGLAPSFDRLRTGSFAAHTPVGGRDIGVWILAYTRMNRETDCFVAALLAMTTTDTEAMSKMS